MRLAWLKEVPFALLGWLIFRLSSIWNFHEQLKVKIYSNYPALPYSFASYSRKQRDVTTARVVLDSGFSDWLDSLYKHVLMMIMLKLPTSRSRSWMCWYRQKTHQLMIRKDHAFLRPSWPDLGHQSLHFYLHLLSCCMSCNVCISFTYYKTIPIVVVHQWFGRGLPRICSDTIWVVFWRCLHQCWTMWRHPGVWL